MRGYQGNGLVVVLSDVGQTLSNQLRFHLLTTNDDLHPGLQVENTAICLRPLKTKESIYWKVISRVSIRSLKN